MYVCMCVCFIAMECCFITPNYYLMTTMTKNNKQKQLIFCILFWIVKECDPSGGGGNAK